LVFRCEVVYLGWQEDKLQGQFHDQWLNPFSAQGTGQSSTDHKFTEIMGFAFRECDTPLEILGMPVIIRTELYIRAAQYQSCTDGPVLHPY
jgi:hypothetical protein